MARINLPDAEAELDAVVLADRVALTNAIEKLKVYGDRLGAPHSSSIRGVKETLRRLRPRSGRSRWRAFYRRVGDGFVIAAIGPEAPLTPLVSAEQCRGRCRDLTLAKPTHMEAPPMNLDELISFEQLLERQLRDPEFRAEWERLPPLARWPTASSVTGWTMA